MINLFVKEKINTSEQKGVPAMGAAPQLGRESSLSYAAMIRYNMGVRSKPIYPRSIVTIAMNIRFSDKCVDIAAHYSKDLAKMANLLRENPSLIATLEACGLANVPGLSVDIVRLRLKNVMNYLVDNFAISRSRFYVDKLLRQASSSEYFAKSLDRSSGVIITLKYPSVLR